MWSHVSKQWASSHEQIVDGSGSGKSETRNLLRKVWNSHNTKVTCLIISDRMKIESNAIDGWGRSMRSFVISAGLVTPPPSSLHYKLSIMLLSNLYFFEGIADVTVNPILPPRMYESFHFHLPMVRSRGHIQSCRFPKASKPGRSSSFSIACDNSMFPPELVS